MPTISGVSCTGHDPRKPPYPFTEAMNEEEAKATSVTTRMTSKERRFIFGGQ